MMPNIEFPHWARRSSRARVFTAECETAPHSALNQRIASCERLKGSLRRAYARP